MNEPIHNLSSSLQHTKHPHHRHVTAVPTEAYRREEDEEALRETEHQQDQDPEPTKTAAKMASPTLPPPSPSTTATGRTRRTTITSSLGLGLPPSTPDAATGEGLQQHGDAWDQDSPQEGDDPPIEKNAASSDGSDEEDDEENSSDTDEKCVKRPRLDEDLVTEWYAGPPMQPRDQRQCDEYFFRGRSLIRCVIHLRSGHALSARHSRRMAHTLYAGKHNSLEHRTKNSDYVRRARAEYEALLLILHRRDKPLMQRYVLAALVAVQRYHQLLHQVRLMEVALHLLQGEDTGVEDLHTLVALCRPLDYAGLEPFLRRPAGEVLVGVVHSLLYRMKLRDLQAILHHSHKTIYSLACAPVLGLLGYHGAQPRPDPALLYNNSAKVFHDYLGEEAHLQLLVALRASLITPGLGPLSDLLLDRLARAARICHAPVCLLPLLERHLQATDGRPGPQGCVAMLRLLRRCRPQLGQLQNLPALLQRLVALLVFNNDRPMTVARDLGRLLILLREERPSLLQATVEAGKTAIRARLDGAVSDDVPGDAAQHFLVNLMRIVVGGARAVPLPPATSSDSDRNSDSESDAPQEPEIQAPPPEEIAATLLGLLGRQAEPRASWSSLACEMSQLLLPRHSGPQDVLVVTAALQLAIRLHDTRADDRDGTDRC